MEEGKKSKDRDLKRIRDEMERVKKQGEDKLKKVEADSMFDRDLLEREAKEKLD